MGNTEMTPLERSKVVSLEKPIKLKFFPLLFSFKGRVCRSQFLFTFLPISIAPFVFFDDENLYPLLIAFAISLWPQLALLSKRYHDMSKSGYWGLQLFFPGIGWLLVLAECGFAVGDFKDNKYGRSLYKK